MKKANNPLLKVQLANQSLIVQRFAKECEMSAMKNDGVIDPVEKKVIEKVQRESEKYIKEISKLIELC